MAARALRFALPAALVVVASALVVGACSKKSAPPAESTAPAPSAPASASASAAAASASTAPSATPSATPVVDDGKLVADGARKAALKCFGTELAKDPKAGGKVTLRVALAATGKALKVDVVDTTSSKALTDCVVEAVQKTSYPDVKAASTVTVPFVFKD